MKLLHMILIAGFIPCSAANAVTTLSGTVTINMAGKFKNPVTPLATLKCSAIVTMVPINLSVATLGSILSALGEENAGAQGVIATGGATFTCAPTVQYRWENIDPTMVQMAITYRIVTTDPGGSNPGKKVQLIEIIPIPAAGTVTTLNVRPKL
ncbi:MAG: hypothetical protein ACREDD_12370 [Methylocella sp.]